MIVVDTSVWIDHIRSGNAELNEVISNGTLRQHPYVTAELALGTIPKRDTFLAMLDRFPVATMVGHADLLDFVARTHIHGTGLGMVDAHLLASAQSQAGTKIWTLDKRLLAQAERLNIAYAP